MASASTAPCDQKTERTTKILDYLKMLTSEWQNNSINKVNRQMINRKTYL